MLHAVSIPCLLLQDAGCAFEDASLRRIGALQHSWPELMTCPHLLGIVLAPEAPAPPGGPAAPVWCPQDAPASAAAHTPGRAELEPVRDNAPEDFEGALAQRIAANVTRTPSALLAPAEAEAWARRVVAAMRSVLLEPGGQAAAEAGQTHAGMAAAGRSSKRQRASEPEASGAGAELLQAPVADMGSETPASPSVLLRPGGQTADEAGQTPAGWATTGPLSKPQRASEPAARGAGGELLQAPVADTESGCVAAGSPHEPARLPHEPVARRSARVAARLARIASRGREIRSTPTGGDAPPPKRVCTEAWRSAGCAQAGAALQTAGFDGAHTDREDLRRPGEQEPASSMAGAAAAVGLPAGPGQESGVLAGLAPPVAADDAAGVARPEAALGLNPPAGFAALHSQGAAQGRPGSLGSPAECANGAVRLDEVARSRQALDESTRDRMRMGLLAACGWGRKAARLPADPGV